MGSGYGFAMLTLRRGDDVDQVRKKDGSTGRYDGRRRKGKRLIGIMFYYLRGSEKVKEE